jgi:HAD superfamily hydrolase (TIGR01509 family)
MTPDAIIFDLDGTLLDTNEMHARAWKQALEEFGHEIAQDRIALQIGKGGDRLVPSLLGDGISERESKKMRDRHGEIYRKMVEREGVKVFPMVQALFNAVHQRGLRVAIATASEKEDLEKVVKRAGLNLLDLADEVVNDSDVEESKPAPDVVEAAVKKLKLPPDRCVMVGDTPYDMQAGVQAGVACIGVLTGVHSGETLREAGARAVFRDTRDLLARLDEVLYPGDR